mgnify:CR=1 FL=1
MNTKKMLLSSLILGSLLVAQIGFAAEKVELSLAEAIERALKTEPRLGMSRGSVETAKGGMRSAQGEAGLSIGFGYKYSRGAYSKSVTPITTSVNDSHGSNVQASLPIFTSGVLSGNIDKQTGSFRASEYSYDQTLQTVRLDATTAYYNVLAYRDVVKLNKESVERLKAHLANVIAQFEVGTVARVDVLRSQVELANAEQLLIKSQNDFDVAVIKLLNIVGLPLDSDLSLKEELKYQSYSQTLEECLAYAMTSRPDLYQAAHMVKGAKGGLQAARGGYGPQVAAFATNEWGGETFPGSASSKWTVGATLNMNILDSGVTAGKVDQARGNLTNQTEQQRQTVLNANLEVRSAYLGLRESEKRIGTAEVAVSQAEEDYKIAQLRYQAGVGTNVDVLDSQVALTTAQNNYVSALYTYNTSKASLDKAMGIPTGYELKHKYDAKAKLNLLGVQPPVVNSNPEVQTDVSVDNASVPKVE